MRMGYLLVTRCPLFVSRWFHGKMKREEAEELLDHTQQGMFLVRESNNYPGDYTLCVVSESGKVEHYHILYENNKLTLDNEGYFENLIALVEVRSVFRCENARALCIVCASV